MAYRKLPPRLKRFVDMTVNGATGPEAGRAIKPDSTDPRKLAWKLRQIPKIAAAIAERDAQAMDNAGITSTRAWIEVARIAHFDHRKLVDAEDNPIPLHKLDDDTAAAIAGIDVEELFAGRGEERALVGTLKKYRAWNKVDALKMILQARKELVERHEMTGKDGAPLIPRTVDDLTDEQLAAIAAGGRPAPAEPPSRATDD